MNLLRSRQEGHVSVLGAVNLYKNGPKAALAEWFSSQKTGEVHLETASDSSNYQF
jgi:hypothetical protein